MITDRHRSKENNYASVKFHSDYISLSYKRDRINSTKMINLKDETSYGNRTKMQSDDQWFYYVFIAMYMSTQYSSQSYYPLFCTFNAKAGFCEFQPEYTCTQITYTVSVTQTTAHWFNSLVFRGIRRLCVTLDTGTRPIIKVKGHQCRWLAWWL